MPINTYPALASAYYPADTPMEGGHFDRRGHLLQTLQSHLAGRSPFCSVAMDLGNGLRYGTPIRIPEIESLFNRFLTFLLVDTGAAFNGKLFSRIDICVADVLHSYAVILNGPVNLQIWEP